MLYSRRVRISHISAINVSRKNRGLLYVYLTVEVFSQAIPDLFNPEIDFHPGSPSN